MPISMAEVDHIATLARIALSNEERLRFRDQLNQIIGYIGMLQEPDTSQVPPSAQVIQIENVTRPDVARPGLTHEQAFQNAPARADDFFQVPAVLEE